MTAKRQKAPRQLEVRIDSVAPGGDGVGSVDGKPCFVPFSAPGDRLIVDVVRENSRMIHGVISELQVASPQRVEPECPLFQRCGGCQWQHMAYPVQISALEGSLRRALRFDDVLVRPSPKTMRYRRVARLHHQRSRKGGSALGFLAFRSHEVVPFDSCPVLLEELERAVAQVKTQLVPHLPGDEEIRLAAGRDGVIAHVQSARSLPGGFYRGAEALLQSGFVGVTADIEGIAATVAGSPSAVQSGGDDFDFEAPSGSFGQANGEINMQLAELVGQWIAAGDYTKALELFAGAGNLSVVIAPVVGRLLTGELDPAACRAAERNAAARGFTNVGVQRGDALEIYRSVHKKCELVVLDPPRTGSLELAKAIAGGNHRAVLYVSCNPATLGRDVDAMKEGGFEVVRAAGFDMFPQTSHMEAVVLLEKRAAAA